MSIVHFPISTFHITCTPPLNWLVRRGYERERGKEGGPELLLVVFSMLMFSGTSAAQQYTLNKCMTKFTSTYH